MGSHRLTPRERLVRMLGGLVAVVLGFAIFKFSREHDPANRAALLAILAVLFGATWIGQGLRGIREGLTYHDERVSPGPAISPERSVAGILLAWAVPGLGHWVIGRRAKALLFFVTITLVFGVGVLLAQGRNLSYERDGIYFLAYMFNAGETAIGWALTKNLERTHEIRFLHVGFLYTAVACLLNLVVMMDFLSTCIRSARREA